MKAIEVHTKTIGGNTFYIRPLPAFRAANASGNLTAFFGPLISSLAPLAAGAMTSGGGVFDMDVNTPEMATAIANAFLTVSGDKVEALLRQLLLEMRNIHVDVEGEAEAQLLTEDLANEVFCEGLQDMYILAFEVIRTNYSGFFKKLGDQFGALIDRVMTKMAPGSEDMGSSTPASSPSSS